ncbi:DNA internalization-related competence protein ComEC/Rec2 [Glaciimonas soli]|uniref:DNA internalization-related competence protein ComEC/Rec2 n=1 Tax=Glaciimonas soli TaxID=2590999 RepID=A0A843YPC1_9BURK|nr:DNA internalization-related competence protein ComEC/Rec2 [Glaciimonas soli]MQQ99826.1 DNA internalization-related competence protein ComEC/Rec2 [Glaciimonas soli]
MRSCVIGFLFGVVYLQTQAGLPSAQFLCILLLLFGISAVLIFYSKKLQHRFIRSSIKTFSFIICGALFGFCWAALFAYYYLRQELPPEWEGRDITLIGTVANLPAHFEQGVRFNFAVEQVLPQDGETPSVPSLLALSWYRLRDTQNPQLMSTVGDIQPGARWKLTVRLKRPNGNANPAGFDYEIWLLEQNLRATGYVHVDLKKGGRNQDANRESNRLISPFVFSLNHVIQRGRGWLRQRIESALPNYPYAGVLVALVIGDQRDIDQADRTIFARTGVSHIIAISGLHISLVAGLFAALVSALWRRSFFTQAELPLLLPTPKVTAVSGALMALIYVALAGFGIPAQRALVMLLMVTLALWVGRISSISHVLCAALGVVVLYDPWAVLSNGFWLSYGAVAMILYASVGRTRARVPHEVRHEDKQNDDIDKTGQSSVLSWLRRWLKARRSALRAAANTQYAVTIGLIPLTMLLFGQTSLFSPIANAVAIPLVGTIVTPAALLGAVLPAPFSGWVLLFSHTLVVSLVMFLTWLSHFSFAVWTAPLPSPWIFGITLMATLWWLAPRGWPLRWLALFGWLPLILNDVSRPAEGEMWVTAFDIGQGMSLLIETKHHRLLYDAGPAYAPGSDAGSRVIVPYLKARGISHLNAVVISHSDSDHSGGALTILNTIKVDQVISSLPETNDIVLNAAEHRRCQRDQSWQWDGIQFAMLSPPLESYQQAKLKPNAFSCTLKISDGKFSILLPGDIEAAQEQQLLTHYQNDIDVLQSTVLLAPHHGSGTSSTADFLHAVDPRIALFQVGYRNRYHHPKASVWQRYMDMGITNLRSDESGAITLRMSAKGGVEFTEYRKEHARYWYGH